MRRVFCIQSIPNDFSLLACIFTSAPFCCVFGWHFCRTLETGAVFNVLVLIGSLIGSVIVAFTFLLRTLEEYCGIPTGNENENEINAGAGHRSKQLDDADAKSSSSATASKVKRAGDSQYADFDRDGDANDDNGAMAPVPYRGDVVYSANAATLGNAAIEMQAVSVRAPPPPPPPPPPPHMLQRATSVALDDVTVSHVHPAPAAAVDPSSLALMAATLARLSGAMERIEGRMDEQSRRMDELHSYVAQFGGRVVDGNGEAIANDE